MYVHDFCLQILGLTDPQSPPAAPRLKSIAIAIARLNNGAVSQSTILTILIKTLNAHIV